MLHRAILTLCLLIPMSSVAEIERIAVVNQGGTRVMWWPKVTPPQGWHQDKGASQANGFNVLVPDGANFNNAETVMYARANYKPRDPGVRSVQELIDRDQAQFRKSSPEMDIKESKAVTIADGTAMRSFTYAPGKSGKGNWECVAYGEDGDYYLTFVVSSRSQKGFDAARSAYAAAIASYTRDPPAAVPAPN